jgi:hypothetical protein
LRLRPRRNEKQQETVKPEKSVYHRRLLFKKIEKSYLDPSKTSIFFSQRQKDPRKAGRRKEIKNRFATKFSRPLHFQGLKARPNRGKTQWLAPQPRQSGDG